MTEFTIRHMHISLNDQVTSLHSTYSIAYNTGNLHLVGAMFNVKHYFMLLEPKHNLLHIVQQLDNRIYFFVLKHVNCLTSN